MSTVPSGLASVWIGRHQLTILIILQSAFLEETGHDLASFSALLCILLDLDEGLVQLLVLFDHIVHLNQSFLVGLPLQLCFSCCLL